MKTFWRVSHDLFTVSKPTSLTLILEGWACRYKQLEDGRKQIISLLLPGDLCEPYGLLPRFTSHSLGALTPVVLAKVPPDVVRNAARISPRIEEALWRDMLVGIAENHERVVNLGRRSASERLGHLFCELHVRLGMVGLADETGYEMPLTQIDLGDLLGLSSVHVNRSLQGLRAMGLVSLRGRRLTIHDPEELRAASLFNAAYLHSDSPA